MYRHDFTHDSSLEKFINILSVAATIVLILAFLFFLVKK